MKAINVTNSTVLATKLEVANGFYSKLKGLIGRDCLEEGSGLWMARCRAIHTFWMRFPIDVVFLDKDLTVRKAFRGVKPFHQIVCCFSAKGVLELPEGTIERAHIRIGDRIEIKK